MGFNLVFKGLTVQVSTV